MARPTRRGGFPPRRAKNLTWGLGPQGAGQLLTVTGKTLWTTGTTPSQELTLMRTRGFVSVTQQSATAIGDGFFGAHGIYMMTEDAFNIGVTAALDPLTDANSDMWIWHHFFETRAITSTEGDGANAVAGVSRIDIDSKAMRKSFDPERVMVGVTGVRLNGTAVAEMHAEVRQLFSG